MIETIDVRATLRHAPRGLAGWDCTRRADGRTSFRYPAPPPGVSLCSYARTPDGDHRARMEFNATSLVHGPEKACYSLQESEMGAVVSAALEAASSLLGGSVPGPEGWEIHRLDPSMTYALPDDLPCPEVVTAVHRAFRLLAEPRHVVSLHNDQTATWIRAKWRSAEVYDKGADARRKGIAPDVLNLLRVEQRIRPRNATGDWKMARRTNLAQVDALAARSMAENLQLLADLGTRMAAGESLTLVRALIRGGASVNAALRLSAAVELERAFGGEALQLLGVADSTARRWSADTRKYLAASGGVDAALEDLPTLLAGMVPAFAAEHDVKITRKGKSDE